MSVLPFRGGFEGRNRRPSSYEGLQGPAVAVAYDEASLRRALGKYSGRTVYGSFCVLLVGAFPLAAGITIENPYISLVGLGRVRLQTSFTGATFTVKASDVTIESIEITGTSATMISVTSSVERLHALWLTCRSADLLSVSSGKTLDRSVFEGCETDGGGAVSLRGSSNRFTGCDVDTLTVLTGDNNVFSGGSIATSADDSASSGNNAVVGATGGATYAAWTGSGSVTAGVT